jgi:hypothetical protein
MRRKGEENRAKAVEKEIREKVAILLTEGQERQVCKYKGRPADS